MINGIAEYYPYQEWLYTGLTSNNEYLAEWCRKEVIASGEQYINANKQYL